MSSTTSTCLPVMSRSRSLRIRTTPRDLVPEPYDDTAIQSISTGLVQRPREVGHDHDRALEDADQQQRPAGVVGVDRRRPARRSWQRSAPRSSRTFSRSCAEVAGVPRVGSVADGSEQGHDRAQPRACHRPRSGPNTARQAGASLPVPVGDEPVERENVARAVRSPAGPPARAAARRSTRRRTAAGQREQSGAARADARRSSGPRAAARRGRRPARRARRRPRAAARRSAPAPPRRPARARPRAPAAPRAAPAPGRTRGRRCAGRARAAARAPRRPRRRRRPRPARAAGAGSGRATAAIPARDRGPGAAGQPEQHRLGLVVAGVAEQHRGRAGARRGRVQRGVARRAGRGLRVRRRPTSTVRPRPGRGRGRAASSAVAAAPSAEPGCSPWSTITAPPSGAGRGASKASRGGQRQGVGPPLHATSTRAPARSPARSGAPRPGPPAPGPGQARRRAAVTTPPRRALRSRRWPSSSSPARGHFVELRRRAPGSHHAPGSVISAREGRSAGELQTRLKPSMPTRSTTARDERRAVGVLRHLRVEPEQPADQRRRRPRVPWRRARTAAGSRRRSGRRRARRRP